MIGGVFARPRVLILFPLGFAAGLPYLLVGVDAVGMAGQRRRLARRHRALFGGDAALLAQALVGAAGRSLSAAVRRAAARLDRAVPARARSRADRARRHVAAGGAARVRGAGRGGHDLRRQPGHRRRRLSHRSPPSR